MKLTNLTSIGTNILRKDRISYAILFTTSACNSRCKTCFYSGNLNARKDELTLPEIERIAKSFGHLPYLLLGGGEPFMRKEFAEIALAFNRHAGTRFISSPTNALLPERVETAAEKILREADDVFLRISISIDGIGTDHDDIRGVPGNWEKLRETYARLDKLRQRYPNFNIDCGTCYNFYNQDKIREIFTYVSEHFAFNNHTLGFIREGGPDARCLEVDVERYQREIAWINNRRKQAENRPLSPAFRAVTDVNAEIISRTLNERRMILPCTAGKKMVVIYEAGDVFPCEELPDHKMGNIRDFDSDIYRLLDSPKAREVVDFIRETDCFCTWECGINSNLFFDKRNYPLVARRMAKNIARKLVGADAG